MRVPRIALSTPLLLLLSGAGPSESQPTMKPCPDGTVVYSYQPCPTGTPRPTPTAGAYVPPPPTATPQPLWSTASFKASDIAVGRNGSVWFIGADGVAIFRVTGSAPQQWSGGGSRIAVDGAGNPWVTNAGNQIWRWTGSTWQLMPGAGKDIAIGDDGSVWVIGADNTPLLWNGTAWKGFGGGGASITVNAQGEPLVTNAGGELWYLYGFSAYKTNPSAPAPRWVPYTRIGGVVDIAADPYLWTWATTSDGRFWKCSGDPNAPCELQPVTGAWRVGVGRAANYQYTLAAYVYVVQPGFAVTRRAGSP